ncbi:MAG: hypothetical protein ACPGO5_02800 [Patescibacteria group bacterium]
MSRKYIVNTKSSPWIPRGWRVKEHQKGLGILDLQRVTIKQIILFK